MEENVRIVITGNNRDALSKLNKVEQAVNRLNSAANKVEVKVTGLQEAERQAARLYQALERVENAALSKLPQSLQTVIAYLKAANAGLGEFTKRAITAAAAVGDIGRVPFAPIIKAQSQAIRQFQQMQRGLVSLRVEFVRVFDRGSTQPLLDGLNLVRVSVLETKGLLEGRGDFTRPMLDGLDLVKVRILEIKGLLGGLGGGGGGGGRIPPAVPPNAPRLPQGVGPQGPQGRGFAFDPTTLRGLRQGIGYFRELLETAEIGSKRFRVLEDTIADLNKKLEDAQLQFQKATTTAVPGSLSALRAEIAAKEASLNQTKRGTREFNELADELRRLNRELSKTENFIEGRTKGGAGRVGTALQSAALGGGFPLLFSGPSFSAAGGAAGGFAGGLIGQGAGFAGGILGSAAGAAIDTFVQKAAELGRALRNPTDNIDALVESLGILGSTTNDLITELKALGANEIAAAVATQQLSSKLAGYGIDTEQFVNETTKFDNALKDLQLAFAAFGVKFIPLINFLTRTVANFVGPSNQGFSASNAVQGAATANNTIEAAERTRNKLLRDTLDVQKQLTANKQRDLQLTDSQRATLESNLKLQQNQAELDKLMLRMFSEQNIVKKRILNNEILITKEKRKQIIADQEAASARSIQERTFNVLRERIKQRGLQAQATQLSATFAQQNLSPLQAIRQRVTAVLKLRDVEDARIQDLKTMVEEEIGLEDEIRREKLRTLEAEEQINNRRAALQLNELENLEKLLVVQREIDSIRVSTGQRLQLAESKEDLDRARLTLQSPLGGDAYERELQRLNQIKELRDLQVSQDEQLLSLQERLAEAKGDDAVRIARQKEMQEKVNETIKEEALARQEVERAILNQELALAKVQPVVDAVTTGVFDMFSAILDGSKSAEEAFSDFLKGIAQMLLKTAAQMIATYIAVGVARMFAGVPSSGSTDSFAGVPNSVLDSVIGTRANGGPVKSGNPYIIGERGPELFVPRSSGRVVPNGRFGGGGGGGVNVVVNVDAKGTSASGDSGQAKQLGGLIGAAVQAELIKQQRPGGLLAR